MPSDPRVLQQVREDGSRISAHYPQPAGHGECAPLVAPPAEIPTTFLVLHLRSVELPML